ncbi:MAG: hypothetical protein HGA65_17020, partial [Oscillochloris sp.]|nr:hypothetical protein [Oscillochloris sp.]
DTCRGTDQQLWIHDDVSGKWQSGLNVDYCLASDSTTSVSKLNLRLCSDSRALTLEPNPTQASSWRAVGTTAVVDLTSWYWGNDPFPTLSPQAGRAGELVSWLQPDVDVVTAQGCAVSYPFDATDTASYNRELACDHVAKIQPPYVTPANAARDPSLWPGNTPSSATKVSRAFDFNLQFKDNSYMRMSYAPQNWKATGLYAPAGEIVKVTVSNATEADLAKVYVLLGVHTDVLSPSSLNVAGSQFERYPNVVAKVRLHLGENLVRNPYGGVIELVSEASVAKTINVTIADAIETPHFVQGATSEADWLASQDAPGPWAVIENDLAVLYVKSSDIRDYSFADITALSQFYRNFVQNENDLAGVSATDPSPVQQPPQGQQRFVDDIQPSLGYAHSGYPTMYNSLMNIASLVSRDNWGLYHENGHNNQQAAWSATYGTETTVNLFSLQNADLLDGRSRLIDDGRYTTAIANLNDSTITDKYNYGSGEAPYWWKLVFLDQIRLGFPNLNYNLWAQVMRRYRDLSATDYNAIRNGSTQVKLDTLFTYLCDATNTDLGPHFAAWTVPVSQTAKEYCATKQPLTRQIWLINNEQPLWYHAGSGSGGFLREWWSGISDSSLSSLTSNAAYPSSPSGQEILSTVLEGRANSDDNYGERLRAYLSPPVSGTYSFWLAGNSTAQLLLSSDDDPAHAQSIVTLSEASGYRNFDNGGLDVQHLQRSA